MVRRLRPFECLGWSGQQDLNLLQPLEIAHCRSDNWRPYLAANLLFEADRSDNGAAIRLPDFISLSSSFLANHAAAGVAKTRR
jgi:hypothetical protein